MSAGVGSQYYSAFNPLDIGGCALWLDAADQSTLTLSGTNVTQWRDKSGNNYHQAQSTTANQPIYTTFSNRPYVSYVAASSNFTSNTSMGIDYRNSQIFLVFQRRANTSGGIFSPLTVGQSGDWNRTDGFTIIGLVEVASAGSGANDGTSTNTNLTSYAFTISNNNLTTFRDFGSSSVITRAMGLTAVPNGLYLGIRRDGPSLNYPGDVYFGEALVFNRLLTTTEYQLIEGYLSRKWFRTGFPAAIIPFAPTQISGCAVWLDAADSNSLTFSGSNVSQWRDKSVNGINASQATASNQPVYQSNSINGLPSIQFPAIARNNIVCFDTPAFDFGTSARTSFFVLKNNYVSGTPGSSPHWFWPKTGNGSAAQSLVGWIQSVNRSTFVSLAISAPIGPTFILTNIFGSSTNVEQMYTNGNSSGGVSLTRSAAFINATSGYRIGGVDNADVVGSTYWFDGNIGEIVLFNRALTNTEIQQVEGYLAMKWGLQSSLPSTHPYALLGVSSTHPYYSIVPVTRQFAPIDIPNCALWFDAADPNSMTLSGSNVTQWRDKSGNGRNTSAVTGTPQLSSAGGFGSTPTIYFGTSTAFTGPISYTGTTLTAFVVARVNTVANPLRFFSLGQSGRNDYAFTTDIAVLTTGNTTTELGWYRNFASVGNGSANVTAIYNTPFLYTLNVNGSTGVIVVNGSTTSSGTTSGNFGYSAYSIGAGFTPTLGNYLGNGFIAEVILYHASLTTTQRQQVEGYLAKKWGLIGSTTTIVPYAPTQPSACTLWLDAADSSTITLSGSNVTQWRDKSGSGFNASNTSNYPTFSNSNINFALSNQLKLSPFIPAGTQNVTLAIVWKANTVSNASFQSIIENSPTFNTNVGGWWRFMTYQYGFGGRNADYYGLNEYGSNPTPLSNMPTFTAGTYNLSFITQYSTNGSNFTINNYHNGSLYGTQTYTGAIVAGVQGTMGLNNNGESFNGSIAEVMLFLTQLTDTQRRQIEYYLSQKWGLSGTYTQGTLPFTPNQISTCQLWLDAADSNTLTFSSGSNISQWRDKSGNSNNATSVNNPVYNSTTLGVDFTRTSSQYFTLPDGSFPANNSSYSYFYIFTPRSTALGHTLSFGGSNNGTAGDFGKSCALRTGDAGTGTLQAYWFSYDLQTSNTYTTNVKNFAATYYTSGSTRTIWINFVQGASDTPGTRTQRSTMNMIGAAASSTTITGFLDGQIHEMIVYNTALTTTQRQQVEGYLAGKWGLRTSLPSTHPYALTGLPSTHPYISRNPRVAVFNPRQISGCQLWLDAMDPTTLTLSGSNVTQWNDKSGNGRNAVVVSTSNATWSSNTNGLFFSNSLYTTGLTADPTNETMFLVFNYTATTVNSNNIILSSPNANGRSVGMNEYSGPLYVGVAKDSITWGPLTAVTRNSIYLATIQFISGSSSSISTNGGTATTGSAFSFTSGSNTRLGAASSGLLPYIGYIYELISYNTVLSSSERQQVEGYLAWKWGLSGGYIPQLSLISSFTPTSIPGCVFWLDGDDTSRMTLSGTSITAISDKSASSNALTVSATRPTYTANYRNGRGAITMAGTSFISNSTFSFGLSKRSVFIVVEQTSSAGNNSFQGILSMGGSATIEDFNNSNSIAYTGRGSNSFQNMSFSIVANLDYIQNYGINTAPAPFAIYTDVFSPSSGTLFINGSSNSTDTTASNVGTSVGFTIGGRTSLSSSPTGLLNGYIYEIILYNNALSTAQRQQIEGYLSWKWGVSVSNVVTGLPSTHPYKLIKP